MTSNHAIDYLDKERGICATCDHLLTCRLHCEDEKPVFFCEEFECKPADSWNTARKVYGLPDRYDRQFLVRKPEESRPAFIGLCKTCARFATCTLLKPGGGTFQCDCYEENATEIS